MNPAEEIRKLLQLPETLRLEDFDGYIQEFMLRKADKKLAALELDRQLAILNNFLQLLSLHLKQQYLLIPVPQIQANGLQGTSSEMMTKLEVAKKYRVSKRTINNWINDGLQAIEIGGVLRISEQALLTFIQTHKSKKFNWPSVGLTKKAA